jgi:hypothetical protein
MSEILEHSTVLAAYKAPDEAPKSQPMEPKTAANSACDALYGAAAEAKACFAYEAYITNCRDHSLVPIAKGYIKEFCQPQETVKLNAPATSTELKATEKEFIAFVQKRLNEAGCNAGAADGVMGGKTRSAIRLFASVAGLKYTKNLLREDNFVKKLESASANFCPKKKSNLADPTAKMNPLNIASHWKITCKKSNQKKSFQEFARVTSYDRRTGKISLILTDKNGVTNSAHGLIQGRKFRFYNDNGVFNSDFTKFTLKSKECSGGFIGQALID